MTTEPASAPAAGPAWLPARSGALLVVAGLVAACFASTAPAASADSVVPLAQSQGELSVPSDADDHGVGLDDDWGDDDTAEAAQATLLGGAWSARDDIGSMVSIAASTGAQQAWRSGVTGSGVTVAVIDTGIAPVPGLDQGQVVNGPDLSYESQRSGSRYLDGYGHGTHMAGIIAGRDPDFRADKPMSGAFAGIAPDAQILNMKVASGDGGADVSQVIAAIDWVVQHQSDNGMDVRVINLAYGTASTQPAAVDPLAHAVENAWSHGIVVVTAAGNDGIDAASLLMPATDPYVIAVGAVDHQGTRSVTDDTVADFSNGGNASRRPDLLAPGKSVVSLRVRGSYIDELHPEGRIETDVQKRFFRGSGTSQATAVVSGAVALLLSRRPGLTPDQVKALLRGTADKLATYPSPAMGAGVLDIDGALAAKVPSAGKVLQDLPSSTGLGSLEDSRGGEHVIDPVTGIELTGETDALGDPWDGPHWAAASAAGQAWDAGVWGTRAWTGDAWTTAGWSAVAWAGASWAGVAWSDHNWSEAYWESSTWRDDSWLSSTWRYATWEARSWRSDSWLSSTWRSDSFLSSTWRTSL